MNSFDPMGGKDVVGGELDAVPPAVPGRDRLAEGRGAGDLGVGVRVGRLGQCPSDDVGRGVHRGADAEVDDAALVRGGPLLVRSELVPGEVGQVERHGGQARGCAMTTGWSAWITPTFAAPPGEPISEKNSTLAL
jgi:hypothetical protein